MCVKLLCGVFCNLIVNRFYFCLTFVLPGFFGGCVIVVCFGFVFLIYLYQQSRDMSENQNCWPPRPHL